MSLKLSLIKPVPELTARIAHAAFPNGNPYLTLRDELGTLYDDKDFAALFPRRGQPGLAPWRLALVTVLQFRENLADRQAAEAVRARIDWKYLLGLELSDPGFDFSVLSEFRGRLIGGQQEALLREELGMQTYFADPYCAWQRGTNESTNGLIRRYFPKRTDFQFVSQQQVNDVVARLNSTPRKVLDYQTRAHA